MIMNTQIKKIYLKAFIISLLINCILIIFISNLISRPAPQTEESYMELSLLDNIPPLPTPEEAEAIKSSKESSFWNKIIPKGGSPATQSAVSEKSVDNASKNTDSNTTPDAAAVNASNSGSAGGTGVSANGNASSGSSANGSTGTGTAVAKPAEIIAPYVISKVLPDYNDEANKNGQQGEVNLKVFISAAGIPDRVEVTGSSGYRELDRAAIAAAKQWRFSPAKNSQTGETLPSQVTITISFNLN